MAILPVFQKLKGRYEFHSILGQGGMGIIYRAYDPRVRRLVAIKTIRDTPDETALELFERECKILAQLSHPNVIEIFDVGEFEEGGSSKPYFVMPLLTGRTLEELIQESPEPVPVGRSIEILSQACRGLQSAHEQGLIHRDLKPSNIFVLDDDSVKIIDFGVAHMMSGSATVGRRGTPWYMAPEQIEMEPLTPRCDQFALGVVSYQMFTGRRPFVGTSEREVARSIMRQTPAPACTLNSGVSEILSQVTAKALAKKPERRWENLREFATCLRLAYHGGPIPAFDPARFQPRIDRAVRALQQGDVAFADEILHELEDEGYTGGEIATIRGEIDDLRRQNTIADLLLSARRRVEECEYPLALQKVAEILSIDPTHAEALALEQAVRERHRAEKVAQWFRIAARHLDARAFSDARGIVQHILESGDPEERGSSLLAEIDRRENEYRRLTAEKEKLFSQALGAWHAGNVASALARLGRLIELDGLCDESAALQHRKLYDQLIAEQHAIEMTSAGCSQALARGDFDNALALCDTQLARVPASALLKALRVDVIDAHRRYTERELSELHVRLAAETDLDRKVDLLQKASNRFPAETHLRLSLEATCERRDLIRSLASSARGEEEAGNYGDALNKWLLIRNVYSPYPGAEAEIGRLSELSEGQARAEACTLLILRTAQQIETGQLEEAFSGLAQARREFPDTLEFFELEQRAEARRALRAQALELLAEGLFLREQGKRSEALIPLRASQQRDPHNPQIRAALVDELVESGRLKAGTNWPAARIAATEALALDPASQPARSLLALAEAHLPASQPPRTKSGTQGWDTGIAEATPPPKPATPRLQTIRAETPEPSVPRPPMERVTDPPAAPAPPRAAWERLRALSRRQLMLIGTGILLLLIPAAIITTRHNRSQGPAPAGATTFPLHIYASPSGAGIRVDRKPAGTGEVTVALSAGEHRIEVSLPGYRPSEQLVRVGHGMNAGVDVTLLPVVSWYLYTDAADASVNFDNGVSSEVNAGRFDVEDLRPGQHVAVVKTGRGEARFAFEERGNDVAVNSGAVLSEAFLAVLVKSSPGGIVLRASRPGAKAAIGQDSPVTIGEGGLQLPGVTPGDYLVTLLDRGERTSFPLAVRPGQTLTAFVHAGRETGSLVLHSDEGGADIFVNGRKLTSVTNQGETRLPGIPPGRYNIAVAKQGFEPVAAQTVEIVKGGAASLRFDLKHLSPPMAQLALAGTPPGAEVFLDRVRIGVTENDGSFSHPGITPGTHGVELRHQGYLPKTLSLHFDEGQTTRVSGNETAMVAEPRPATIRLSVSPAEATVTFSHPNEPPQPADTKNPITVPKGSWVFTAQAAGYEPLSATVTVGDAETKDVALKLVRKPIEKSDLLAGWQHRENWTAEGTSFVREGGGNVLFDRTPLTGSVTFTAALRKGRRLRWVVSYRDDANHADFELDRKYFTRYQTVDGKSTRLARVPLELDVGKPVFIQILIQKGSLRHFYSADGNHWREIDLWMEGDRNFPDGRFGFVLQGKDTLVLSKFSFVP